MTATVVEPLARARATTPVAHRPIPLSRVTGVELRKMFDTRSGFWLMTGIAIAAVVATGSVLVFGSDEDIVYGNFAAAIGFPMSVILPMVAILSVTGEWSQRSGLTTFTLVPHRGRVIAAKAIAALVVAVVSMLLAFAIGALGNLAGAGITGNDVVWDLSFAHCLDIVLANTLGLMVGFMLGVLLRSSAGAIVAYFVFSMLLPSLSGLLALSQEWYRDLQPWADFNVAQGALFNGEMGGQAWAHLATASGMWLFLPLAVGLALVVRSEVK